MSSASCLDRTPLKTIVPIDGPADRYRDTFYHGGIPSVIPWFLHRAIAARDTVSVSRTMYDDDELRKRVDALFDDHGTSFTRSALVISSLRTPPETRPIIFDALVHPEYDRYWRERSPSEVHKIRVPTYLGAEMHGQSTPVYLGSAAWGWERITAPRKLRFGPHTTGEHHRPFYEHHDELLRWYDHWLKGIEPAAPCRPNWHKSGPPDHRTPRKTAISSWRTAPIASVAASLAGTPPPTSL